MTSRETTFLLNDNIKYITSIELIEITYFPLILRKIVISHFNIAKSNIKITKLGNSAQAE